MNKEENFHDKRIIDELEANIERVGFAYRPINYARNNWIKSLKNLGKTLEIGVWKGDILFKAHSEATTYTGLDLSSEAINFLKIKIKDFELENIDLIHGDFFDISEDKKFDSIIMSGVLHHLDIERVMNKIDKIMNRDGKFYIWEPMPGPIMLRIFRFFTPHLRTDDEAPLSRSFINELKKEYPINDINYCGSSIMITAPLALFRVKSSYLSFIDRIFSSTKLFSPWVIYGYFSKGE